MAISTEPEVKSWGKENYPSPLGVAFIEADELKCVGCGICEMACSMQHYGVINKDLSNIHIRKYLIPLPKAVQVICVQCPPEERECEKACPVTPQAIYFDRDTLHMRVIEETCIGEQCLACMPACSADAIRFAPEVSLAPFLCDLCDPENTGDRDPQCVQVCPYNAIHFKSGEGMRGYQVSDTKRKHADEKAELISKRMYPLPKNSMAYPGWK